MDDNIEKKDDQFVGHIEINANAQNVKTDNQTGGQTSLPQQEQVQQDQFQNTQQPLVNKTQVQPTYQNQSTKEQVENVNDTTTATTKQKQNGFVAAWKDFLQIFKMYWKSDFVNAVNFAKNATSKVGLLIFGAIILLGGLTGVFAVLSVSRALDTLYSYLMDSPLASLAQIGVFKIFIFLIIIGLISYVLRIAFVLATLKIRQVEDASFKSVIQVASVAYIPQVCLSVIVAFFCSFTINPLLLGIFVFLGICVLLLTELGLYNVLIVVFRFRKNILIPYVLMYLLNSIALFICVLILSPIFAVSLFM
jgi:hypothetical protein